MMVILPLDSASDIDDDEKLDEVEFLSSEVERRECEQSTGLADDGDQVLPQATSSTSGQGQEQSSGGRAGASVPTLIDLTNSGLRNEPRRMGKNEKYEY